MTIEELKSIIEKQDSLGLQDVVLKISKKKPFKQTSEYLMTPFGKCLARFNNETKTHYDFIIFVPIVKMKNYLKRILNDQK